MITIGLVGSAPHKREIKEKKLFISNSSVIDDNHDTYKNRKYQNYSTSFELDLTCEINVFESVEQNSLTF
jgi:hypothetical protein